MHQLIGCTRIIVPFCNVILSSDLPFISESEIKSKHILKHSTLLTLAIPPTMFGFQSESPDTKHCKTVSWDSESAQVFIKNIERDAQIREAREELEALQEERGRYKEDEEVLNDHLLKPDQVRKMHAQLEKIKEEYDGYVRMAKAEEKNVRIAMRKLAIARKRKTEIEKGSWKIAMKLGLTDFDAYLGLSD